MTFKKIKNNLQNKPICVFSCLAFGDLLIDCFFLQNDKNIVILTPSYNKEFCEKLKPLNKIEYFDIKTNEIPPLLFNLKSFKLIGIIKSWFELRRVVKFYSKKYTLVYNTNSLRWRTLNIFTDFFYLRKIGQNIYEQYPLLLDIKINYNKNKSNSNLLYIFPDSRQKRRTIPIELLIQICSYLDGVNINYLVVTNRDIKEIKYKTKIDSLDELFNYIKSARAVISAESMPIHLSEYFNKENFLISPGMNTEMFPISLIQKNHWCTYSDLNNFKKWCLKIID
jgi:ADP-heptose:LPS heptosyltransferase